MGSKPYTIETCTRVETCEINFYWKIENFCLLNVKPGEILASQKFSVPNKSKCVWYIDFYPLGTRLSPDHIFLYLRLYDTDQPTILTQFTFELQTQGGKCLARSGVHQVTFQDATMAWGTGQWLKRNLLISLLKDDVLVINCFVKWETNFVTKSSNQVLVNNNFGAQRQLSNDFNQLLKEGIFSDLSLEANDGTKFKAHKNILAARSPVFAAMLKHDMREAQESIVRIEDFNGDTLRTMLEFIYTSGFKKKQCNLIELMAAADKYALDLLKAMCEQECLKNLNIGNAAVYLFLSDQHQAITLKKHSLDFIQIHLKEVLETEAFRNLLGMNPVLYYDVLKSVSNMS